MLGIWGSCIKQELKVTIKTFTFAFMQLFNTMHPGGAMTTSTTTNFSPQHLENFGSSDQSFSHKKYLRISLCFGETATQTYKTLMGPLVRFFGAFGPWVLCCVCVMWIGVVQWGGVRWGVFHEGYAFFTIKKCTST